MYNDPWAIAPEVHSPRKIFFKEHQKPSSQYDTYQRPDMIENELLILNYVLDAAAAQEWTSVEVALPAIDFAVVPLHFLFFTRNLLEVALYATVRVPPTTALLFRAAEPIIPQIPLLENN